MRTVVVRFSKEFEVRLDDGVDEHVAVDAAVPEMGNTNVLDMDVTVTAKEE